MIRRVRAVAFAAVAWSSAFAQSAEIVAFPTDLTVSPFVANFLEPRVGVAFQAARNALRLDIGTSRDVWRRVEGEETISAGVDFFTYTRLRQKSQFRFPVEAIDYLFGVNAAYRVDRGKRAYGARFRLSHVSAHLADGRWDDRADGWMEGRKPFTYSKEFVEIAPFYRFGGTRLYACLTWVFHVIPSYLGSYQGQIGAEQFFPEAAFLGATPFLAYDLRMRETTAWAADNAAAAGVKFGEPFGSGLSLLVEYYQGAVVHGLFHDRREEYVSLGVNVDL
jgi:hypothetical protein